MEENLVGYLLNSLEPDAHRQVAQLLEKDADARRRLSALRHALKPLHDDREPDEPPRGLWIKALGRVAEHMCRELPAAPVVEYRPSAASRRSWRRIDVLVAACVVLTAGLMIPPAVVQLQRRSQRVACADNMRRLGDSFVVYRNNNRGNLPDPTAEKEPFNVAGFAVPLLVDAGVAEDVDLRCPGSRSTVVKARGATELRAMSADEFRQAAPNLLGSYSYSMGYRDRDHIAGFNAERDDLPILADGPPDDPSGQARDRNSPNHDGTGQNMLYPDGRVEFISSRLLFNDDVYLNHNGKQEVGVAKRDIVLAPAATPMK